nr:MAG TPA: hypothetical protein [Caudoviricetes sp.]
MSILPSCPFSLATCLYSSPKHVLLPLLLLVS